MLWRARTAVGYFDIGDAPKEALLRRDHNAAWWLAGYRAGLRAARRQSATAKKGRGAK